VPAEPLARGSLENLIITDPQLVTTTADVTKAYRVSVCFMFRSQYVSCGDKMLDFFDLNNFSDAALASVLCMDEFCKLLLPRVGGISSGVMGTP